MGFTLLALTQSDLGLGQIGNDPELAVSEGAASAGEQSLPPDTGPVVGTPVAQRVAPDDGVALSTAKYGKGNSATPADKSALAVAAPRYRSREHLLSVDRRRAWSAAISRPIRIIFAMRSRARSAARPRQ